MSPKFRAPLAAVALAGVVAASSLAVLSARRAEAGDEPATFKNVKVLTHLTSKQEMRAEMKKMAASLGVKCSHCHVPGKFDLDDKDTKKAARHMLEMTRELNEKFFADAKPEEKPRITCWTCHAGHEKPGREVPAEALAAQDSQDAAPKP